MVRIVSEIEETFGQSDADKDNVEGLQGDRSGRQPPSKRCYCRGESMTNCTCPVLSLSHSPRGTPRHEEPDIGGPSDTETSS